MYPRLRCVNSVVAMEERLALNGWTRDTIINLTLTEPNGQEPDNTSKVLSTNSSQDSLDSVPKAAPISENTEEVPRKETHVARFCKPDGPAPSPPCLRAERLAEVEKCEDLQLQRDVTGLLSITSRSNATDVFK